MFVGMRSVSTVEPRGYRERVVNEQLRLFRNIVNDIYSDLLLLITKRSYNLTWIVTLYLREPVVCQGISPISYSTTSQNLLTLSRVKAYYYHFNTSCKYF